MGTQLKVDTSFLRDSAASIEAIKGAFNGAGDLINQYSYAIQDPSLSGALHDFASN